jgi:putative acetyltransferase
VIAIALESPLQPGLSGLMARHTEAMHADTPPESIHMLDAAELAAPEIAFFVMREDGRPIGMGALKRHDGGLAEIKSMHVLSQLRGRGLARQMLDHLVAEARAAGMRRVSLETGAQESFAPARKLYETAGFVTCPPFAAYRADPMSAYMTLSLA